MIPLPNYIQQMKTFIFKNKVTGEVKNPIKAVSLIAADGLYKKAYPHLSDNWITIKFKTKNK